MSLELWLFACLFVCLTACGNSDEAVDSGSTSSGVAIPQELLSSLDSERVAVLVEIGHEAFLQKGCVACHAPDGQPLTGPGLAGIFGQSIKLQDGRVIERDLTYLYQSMVAPNDYVSQAGKLVMPPYAYLDEQTLVGLAYFVRSLSIAPALSNQDEVTTDE